MTAVAIRGSRALRAGLFAAFLSLGLLGCQFDASSPPVGEKLAGGGGIETVGIRGFVYHENGSPAINARILLRNSEFLADSGIAGLYKQVGVVSGETSTDALGFYAIDSVEPGEYRIEISAENAAQGAVVEASVSGLGGMLQVGNAVVRSPGGLQGRLVQGGSPVVGAWVHVYGMQRSAVTDSVGRLAFVDLPEGVYRLIIRYRKPYGLVESLDLPYVAIEAGALNDLGSLELPGGCGSAACDSMVVRYLLEVNGQGALPVDSVSKWNAETGRIEELDLSGLGIDSLPYVRDLVTLKHLELDNNGMAYLPPEVAELPELEYLSLNRNRLRTLPKEIGNLKSLIGLHLYANFIDTLPPSIGDLPSLRYLTLSFNFLRSIPQEVGRLVNLSQLYVHNNRLENLPESILELPNLAIIDIDNNRLCNLSFRWLYVLDKGTTYEWRAYQSCAPH